MPPIDQYMSRMDTDMQRNSCMPCSIPTCEWNSFNQKTLNFKAHHHGKMVRYTTWSIHLLREELEHAQVTHTKIDPR